MIASSVVHILDVDIDNLTMAGAVERILSLLDQPGPHQVCFVNADCANIARADEVYRRILRDSDLVLGDGIGIRLAGRMLGREIRQNVNGTDLFPPLCEALQGTGKGMYLLGGRPGIAKGVADWVGRHCPGVTVSGFNHGYHAQESMDKVLETIRDSGAAILLVAKGVPMQEKWIRANLAHTNVKVAMGVGGAVRFLLRPNPAGAAMDARGRTGMVLPLHARAPADVAAIFRGQRAIPSAGDAPEKPDAV